MRKKKGQLCSSLPGREALELAFLSIPKNREMIAILVCDPLNALARVIISQFSPIVKSFVIISSTTGDKMIKVNLFDFWKQKEIESGRTITVREVAAATGLSRDTITRIKAGRTAHPDLEVIDKLCKFFNVPPGPIPFVSYNPD